MPWYLSETTEVIEWQWNTKILNSVAGGSGLLHIYVVLELYIAKSLNHNSFLGGLSHTQRKRINPTLDLWPPRLIAEPRGRHHSTAVHPFLLNLDLTSEPSSTQWPRNMPTQNIWTLFATSSEPFYPPVCCRYKMSVSELWCHASKTNSRWKKEIHWTFWYSLQIFGITYLWTTEGNLPQLTLLHLLCQNPIKCRVLSPSPTPKFEFLEIRLQKALVNSDVPPNMWTSTFIKIILLGNPAK